MDYRMLTNDPTSTISELYFGQYTMQFRAERGFGMPLYWEIIEAFVETLLQGTVPMTFMAHIAPPDSDVGMSGFWERSNIHLIDWSGSSGNI
ncbi:MAG: hypothetical protein Q9207_001618 [Kuettlingeria erythrocarpa]